MSKELEYLRGRVDMVVRRNAWWSEKHIMKPKTNLRHKYTGESTNVALVSFADKMTEILVENDEGFMADSDDAWGLVPGTRYGWDYLYNYELVPTPCPMVAT